MFGQKKPNKPIKFRKLKDFYIHKGEKTKFGGKGIGGVYRDKKTGKDYLIKRIDTSDVMWYRNVKAQQKENWRSWDEILAAKFLKAAGVLVPNMFAVEDENGLVYVASSMLPGVKNCYPGDFNNLDPSNKEPVLISYMMHVWLGNRDIVNVKGENFVIDDNNRVFSVDLGSCLYSGFRFPDLDAGYQDAVDFNPSSFNMLMIGDKSFGIMNSAGHPRLSNSEKIINFFIDLVPSTENKEKNVKKYLLAGALLINSFSDKDIEDIVNSTGHTDEDKLKRIKTLKERKRQIIAHIEEKYGKPQAMPLTPTQQNKKINKICLVTPDKTSETQNTNVGYEEFPDGSNRPFSFEEFRELYKKDNSRFDRSSVITYLQYYQREIQKILNSLGIKNIIVQISKKPETIGKIYIKPSIEEYKYSKYFKKEVRSIKNNAEFISLINKISSNHEYDFIKKNSNQSRDRHNPKEVRREIFRLKENINPATFHKSLVMYQDSINVNNKKEMPTQSDTDNKKSDTHTKKHPLPTFSPQSHSIFFLTSSEPLQDLGLTSDPIIFSIEPKENAFIVKVNDKEIFKSEIKPPADDVNSIGIFTTKTYKLYLNTNDPKVAINSDVVKTAFNQYFSKYGEQELQNNIFDEKVNLEELDGAAIFNYMQTKEMQTREAMSAAPLQTPAASNTALTQRKEQIAAKRNKHSGFIFSDTAGDAHLTAEEKARRILDDIKILHEKRHAIVIGLPLNTDRDFALKVRTQYRKNRWEVGINEEQSEVYAYIEQLLRSNPNYKALRSCIEFLPITVSKHANGKGETKFEWVKNDLYNMEKFIQKGGVLFDLKNRFDLAGDRPDHFPEYIQNYLEDKIEYLENNYQDERKPTRNLVESLFNALHDKLLLQTYPLDCRFLDVELSNDILRAAKTKEQKQLLILKMIIKLITPPVQVNEIEKILQFPELSHVSSNDINKLETVVGHYVGPYLTKLNTLSHSTNNVRHSIDPKSNLLDRFENKELKDAAGQQLFYSSTGSTYTDVETKKINNIDTDIFDNTHTEVVLGKNGQLDSIIAIADGCAHPGRTQAPSLHALIKYVIDEGSRLVRQFNSPNDLYDFINKQEGGFVDTLKKLADVETNENNWQVGGEQARTTLSIGRSYKTKINGEDKYRFVGCSVGKTMLIAIDTATNTMRTLSPAVKSDIQFTDSFPAPKDTYQPNEELVEKPGHEIIDAILGPTEFVLGLSDGIYDELPEEIEQIKYGKKVYLKKDEIDALFSNNQEQIKSKSPIEYINVLKSATLKSTEDKIEKAKEKIQIERELKILQDEKKDVFNIDNTYKEDNIEFILLSVLQINNELSEIRNNKSLQITKNHFNELPKGRPEIKQSDLLFLKNNINILEEKLEQQLEQKLEPQLEQKLEQKKNIPEFLIPVYKQIIDFLKQTDHESETINLPDPDSYIKEVETRKINIRNTLYNFRVNIEKAAGAMNEEQEKNEAGLSPETQIKDTLLIKINTIDNSIKQTQVKLEQRENVHPKPGDDATFVLMVPTAKIDLGFNAEAVARHSIEVSQSLDVEERGPKREQVLGPEVQAEDERVKVFKEKYIPILEKYIEKSTTDLSIGKKLTDRWQEFFNKTPYLNHVERSAIAKSLLDELNDPLNITIKSIKQKIKNTNKERRQLRGTNSQLINIINAMEYDINFVATTSDQINPNENEIIKFLRNQILTNLTIKGFTREHISVARIANAKVNNVDQFIQIVSAEYKASANCDDDFFKAIKKCIESPWYRNLAVPFNSAFRNFIQPIVNDLLKETHSKENSFSYLYGSEASKKSLEFRIKEAGELAYSLLRCSTREDFEKVLKKSKQLQSKLNVNNLKKSTLFTILDRMQTAGHFYLSNKNLPLFGEEIDIQKIWLGTITGYLAIDHNKNSKRLNMAVGLLKEWIPDDSSGPIDSMPKEIQARMCAMAIVLSRSNEELDRRAGADLIEKITPEIIEKSRRDYPGYYYAQFYSAYLENIQDQRYKNERDKLVLDLQEMMSNQSKDLSIKKIISLLQRSQQEIATTDLTNQRSKTTLFRHSDNSFYQHLSIILNQLNALSKQHPALPKDYKNQYLGQNSANEKAENILLNGLAGAQLYIKSKELNGMTLDWYSLCDAFPTIGSLILKFVDDFLDNSKDIKDYKAQTLVQLKILMKIVPEEIEGFPVKQSLENLYAIATQKLRKDKDALADLKKSLRDTSYAHNEKLKKIKDVIGVPNLKENLLQTVKDKLGFLNNKSIDQNIIQAFIDSGFIKGFITEGLKNPSDIKDLERFGGAILNNIQTAELKNIENDINAFYGTEKNAIPIENINPNEERKIYYALNQVGRLTTHLRICGFSEKEIESLTPYEQVLYDAIIFKAVSDFEQLFYEKIKIPAAPLTMDCVRILQVEVYKIIKNAIQDYRNKPIEEKIINNKFLNSM